MVMITLYAKQKKRHRCTEQTLGLCGRRGGWGALREQHWNKYTIKGETEHQPRLDAWDMCSGLVHWRPRGMGWGGRWEGGSGWGTHVNPWLIHINVWQKPLQYCKVISFQLIKINGKKKKHAHRKNNRETHSLLSLKISRLVLGGSVVKEPTCQSRRSGSMPGSGRFPWRKKWQPTPVLLPGKSHGQRSLMG